MKSKTGLFKLISIILLSYVANYIYFVYFLKFNFFHSDALSYWQDSLSWQQPFHPYHVPGYPLLIALLHGLLGELFQPVHLMQLIVLCSFLLSIFFVYKIVIGLTKNQFQAELGCLVFGLFPFVGITYVLDPRSDSVVMMLFLGGIWFLLRKNYYTTSVFWGFAIITHKAIWPFVGLGFLMQFICKDKKLRGSLGRTFVEFGILILPITLLWLFGAKYHSSYFWIIRANLETEISTRSSLPLLDGIIGTLLNGGFKNIVKLIIVLAVFISSGYFSYYSISSKNTTLMLYGFPIALGVFFLTLTINQYEIWAAVRFSKLLALPAVLLISNLNSRYRIVDFFHKKQVYIGLFCGLIASNLLYAWYMANVFFV
jgi:Gpi18-like mannosyltransferase